MVRAGALTFIAVACIIAFAASPATAWGQVSSGGTHSPHGNLNLPCQNCHTANAWRPIRAVPEFDHNQTRYPLRGMHQSVACVQCHVKLIFNNVGQRCQDCHADIHKRQLGANCEQCHSVRGWQVSIQQIQQHNNRFPLTGAHAAVDCDSCHKGAANSKFVTMSTACSSCHFKDFQTTTNPNHMTAKFSTNCEGCHSSDNWLNAKFDHSTTGFLLTAGHAVPPRECTDCHVNNNYNLSTSACISCHLKDFQGTTNPNHVAANFPSNCAQCHTTSNWTSATFDHSTTGFPLTGAHTIPPRQCTDCHANSNYNLTTATCVSCHLKDFQGTSNPNHVSSNFPQTCQQCHSTSTWSNATFDHSITGFQLTGAHTVPPRQCADCHANNNYNLTTMTCVSCHLKDFQSTTNPNHVSSGFAQTCQQCHSTSTWSDATFDHSTTGFTLTGAHTVPPRQCVDCHVNNNYSLTTATCVSCHLKDFQSTTDPNHVSSGFPQTCQQCHSTSTWSNATFDHSTTGFTLTGAHTVPPRQCTDCHVNNNYSLTSATCVSCHATDFQNATNPNHVSGGFAQTCETCHNTAAWQPATFDHAKSGFPLTGAHMVPPRQCADCHVNNNYSITVTACVSCHQNDYNTATTPVPHAGFPTTCQQCHDTVAWTDGKFDHSTTGFILTGAHLVPPRQCTDCHVNNNYNITATTCISCHQNDYTTATSPVPHAGFPTTCQQCHDTVAWTNGKFDHSTTGFILTGAHLVPPRQCVDCHVNNNYNITATTCISCHQNDYTTATTPVPHAGFPTTCQQCHDTVAWTNGKFDHSTTGFILTGLHTVPPRQCVDCHVNNNYNLTSAACVTCHLKDFQGTTNPSHVASNFPQTCDQCHSTSSWLNATFNHNTTGFPLVGAHTVPPRQCTDCHVNNNYNITATACVSCHQNDYNTATNPINHVTAHFPTTCENCHDTVLWADGKFDHTSTGFTLTGLHTVPPRQCTDCHVNNNYNLTSTACVTCHLKDYQGTTNPNHVSSNFPQTCDQCHSTSTWLNATFNHNSTGFPLTGAHVVPPRQCTDCHVNNNYNLNTAACYSCHQKDYSGTTNPAHASAGFPTTCEVCHDTTVWTDSTFNHNNTAFPLTGSHTVPPRQCTECHVNGNYTTLPTACYGCHQSDYQNTTNPGHAAQQTFFPTTCQTCHTTTAWTGATFNHSQYTRFPVNHGNANGVCATCHTNSNDYSVFQCTGCHGNNNAANFRHPSVSGYVYNSINCYQCHQSGNGG